MRDYLTLSHIRCSHPWHCRCRPKFASLVPRPTPPHTWRSHLWHRRCWPQSGRQLAVIRSYFTFGWTGIGCRSDCDRKFTCQCYWQSKSGGDPVGLRFQFESRRISIGLRLEFNQIMATSGCTIGGHDFAQFRLDRDFIGVDPLGFISPLNYNSTTVIVVAAVADVSSSDDGNVHRAWGAQNNALYINLFLFCFLLAFKFLF